MKADAVTYSPINHTFYEGSLEQDYNFEGKNARNYHPIARLRTQKMQYTLQGNVMKENPHYDPEDMIEPIDYEMYRKVDRTLQAAVNETALKNLTRVELLTAIINAQYKKVYLINGVNQVPVQKLKLDYDVQLHVKTRGKAALIKKRQKPNVEAPDFVQANFDMVAFGKLSRQIDSPDEDELSALISPLQKSLDDVAQVLGQDENLLILDAMDTFVVKAKGSWSALATSGNVSARSPLADIATERNRITKNHGRVDTLAMNSIDYANFVGNTYVKGYESLLTQQSPGVFTFDKLPGITFIVDEDITTGNAYLYDRRAIAHGIGPMISESFRDPYAGVSGHVIRKWVQPISPATLASGFAAKMTTL